MKYITPSVLLFLLFLSSQSAFAVDTDYNTAMGRANVFITSVNTVVQNIINDSQIGGFVRSVWLFFSALVLVPALIGWARNANNVDNVIFQCLIVMITGIIMLQYDFLTGLLWNANEGIAGGIQNAAMGNSDPFFLPGFINDVIQAIDLTNVGGILDGIRIAISSYALVPILSGLSILAFIVNIWCLWQFCVGKMIGIFIVPLLLSKRLHFVFDGWLRFIIGATVYGIIARINIVLCAVLIRTYFQLPSYTSPAEAIPLSVEALPQMIGLIAFCLIAILALIQTGRFAQSIVSGATGFGNSLQSIVRVAVGKII
jgi:hypothetical protein